MNNLQEADFSVVDLTATTRIALLDHGFGNDTVAGVGYAARATLLASAVGDVRDKELTDLTQADYEGKVMPAITWSAAARDETGEPVKLAGRITVTATGHDTIPSTVITGVALTGSDSITLLGAVDLPAQAVLSDTQPVSLDIVVSLLPQVNPG